MKKLWLIPLMGAILAGLLTGCQNSGNAERSGKSGPRESQENVMITNWFSGLDTTDMDGNPVTDDIFSDKELTLINVWATFCSPCIREMPELEELYREYRDGPVGIVGLIVDSSRGDKTAGLTEEERMLGKDILRETGVTYPQITASEALLQTNFKRVIQYPTTYFVDSDGKFVGEPVSGAKTKQEWKELIEARLQQLEGNGPS